MIYDGQIRNGDYRLKVNVNEMETYIKYIRDNLQRMYIASYTW